MSRTRGSGWGGGVILYQICPKCGQKKVYYNPLLISGFNLDFKCTNGKCRERFADGELLRITFRSQLDNKQ
jgi:hypothetical protein